MRLYVGGLSQSVTERDLKDRFGKFGQVEDVELKTKKDEHGVPYKTFCYININISDGDLRRCLTVLNKSKWKGGTLQIAAARDCFLHRLAQEQQAALQQPIAKQTDGKQMFLDSLRKAGVDSFNMKAAVPGTEIPGHKNWVVSKFGRVLPVLQLKCHKGSRARTMKYDPSKYSHNIRKINDMPTTDDPTPVASLTWEIQDHNCTRNKNDEFVPHKAKNNKGNVSQSAEASVSCNGDLQPKRSERSAKRTKPQRRPVCVGDSDSDSDEEIHPLEAARHLPHGAFGQDTEEDDAVVEHHPRVKKCSLKQTEEIAVRSDPTGNTSAKLKKTELKRKPNGVKQMDLVGQCDTANVNVAHNSTEDYGQLQTRSTAASDSDTEHERLSSSPGSPETSSDHIPAQTDTKQNPNTRPELGTRPTARNQVISKKYFAPEDILSDILEEHGEEDEVKKKRRKFQSSVSLPPFRGTTVLAEQLAEEGETQKCEVDDGLGRGREVQTSKVQGHQQRLHLGECLSNGDVGEGQRDAGVATRPDPLKSSTTQRQTSPSSSSASSCDTSNINDEAISSTGDSAEAPATGHHKVSSPVRRKESLGTPVGGVKNIADKKKDNLRRLAAIQQRQKEAEQHKDVIRGALAGLDTSTAAKGKHIVFGSDAESEGDDEQTVPMLTKSKNSLFEESTDPVSEARAPKRKAESICVQPCSSQLFESSEDEDLGETDDGRMFDIRPQFEGQSGQKLMKLQSRFGTDERFRMDSRFLESDEEELEGEKPTETETEESLGDEKRKNLSILNSIMKGSQQPTSNSRKASTFRDVLHYDPSKEEHVTFETKIDDTKQESKAARRKRRKEEQRIPDVPKDVYYNVFGDLKEAFGPKDTDEKNEQMDVEEGDEEQSPSSPLSVADPTEQTEEPAGFQFSFFGDDADTKVTEKAVPAEEQVITITKATPSWRQDQQFHDSSSEDGEDTQESCTTAEAGQEIPLKQDVFFFFHPGDSRLADGPASFCCSSQLEEQRDQWEARRSALREEYRKKHKDAKRKLTMPQRW